jgi:hypothetical protein
VDRDPAAIGFQDLALVLPERVDLRLFAVAPARVGSASDLPEISGSGFEKMRDQDQSMRITALCSILGCGIPTM